MDNLYAAHMHWHRILRQMESFELKVFEYSNITILISERSKKTYCAPCIKRSKIDLLRVMCLVAIFLSLLIFQRFCVHDVRTCVEVT